MSRVYTAVLARYQKEVCSPSANTIHQPGAVATLRRCSLFLQQSLDAFSRSTLANCALLKLKVSSAAGLLINSSLVCIGRVSVT